MSDKSVFQVGGIFGNNSVRFIDAERFIAWLHCHPLETPSSFDIFYAKNQKVRNILGGGGNDLNGFETPLLLK